MKRLFAVCLMAVALLLPQTAVAWNSTGHQVVARIAWEKMQPQTRRRVMALMFLAPPDANLTSMLPADGRSFAIRQRELFMRAATWPDLMRSDEFPERKAKYHRSIWHFTNFFWRQQDGVALDVPELQPEPVNIVERLSFLETEVVNVRVPARQRAIDLAWILHLIGDIHQPLHTSARVTDAEPTGDQGGNLFLLTPIDTPPRDAKRLHGYWDDILNKSITRRGNENDLAYANRIATLIMQRHPQSRMRDRINDGQYVVWAVEGLTSAKTSVYPSWLNRFEKPSERYRKLAFSISEPAVAIAGYRLAATLDRLFGD